MFEMHSSYLKSGRLSVMYKVELSIKNSQVEKLLEEVVQMTGESKTEAVRKALEERSLGYGDDFPRTDISLA